MNHDEYLKMAEVEDRMRWYRAMHAHVRHALEGIRLAGKPSLLDAGCGTGGLILRLQAARPDWKFTGIDFSPVAVDLARRRVADATFREASITELPFGAAEFDVVVTTDVLCQVDNPEVALAEFFRVLRPGGTVVINVPAYMWMWSYHDDAVQSKHRFARKELAALMARAGFANVATTHWNALLFPLVWAKRKMFRSAADTSDVKVYPAAVEAVFGGIMAIERGWLRIGGRWPWGSSIFATAQKPAP